MKKRIKLGVEMGERKEAQEERNIYIIMTDSHCCMAETNTKL